MHTAGNTALSTKANKRLLFHIINSFSFIKRRSRKNVADTENTPKGKSRFGVFPFLRILYQYYSVWLLSSYSAE